MVRSGLHVELNGETIRLFSLWREGLVSASPFRSWSTFACAWPEAWVSPSLCLDVGGLNASKVLPIVECVYWVKDAMGEPIPHLMSLMVTTPLLVTNSVTTVLVGCQVWCVHNSCAIFNH